MILLHYITIIYSYSTSYHIYIYTHYDTRHYPMIFPKNEALQFARTGSSQRAHAPPSWQVILDWSGDGGDIITISPGMSIVTIISSPAGLGMSITF